MRIGPVDITRRVLVVAEIGNNHEGDAEAAAALVRRAAASGADAVKFQTIIPEHLVRPDQEARLQQLHRFALDAVTHRRLAAIAAEAGVMFMSTPFSLDAVDLLDPLVPAFKIASGDNDFAPLLARVAATGKPVLLSTGMATAEDAALSAGWIGRNRPAGAAADVVLLHCVSAYPTPDDQANLGAIRDLGRLGHPVGYSDHTLGIDAVVAAVALGARVIEKHFTLSKTTSAFRDHALSAELGEFAEMVRRIRSVELMLGDGAKRPMPAEAATAVAARRSACAARDLPQGHVIGPHDLAWLRPGGACRPGTQVCCWAAGCGATWSRATRSRQTISAEPDRGGRPCAASQDMSERPPSPRRGCAPAAT